MTRWSRIVGAAPITPAPAASLHVETLSLGVSGGVPNHPHWPALIIRGAVPADAPISGIKALYEANRWFRVWDWTVFDYHHFHPEAAEALTVARGAARLHLGGPDGPQVDVTAGDAMVLPAGFGHKRVSSDDAFTVVGGYPEGQEERTIVAAGDMDVADAARAVAAVPPPQTDPLWGADGPLLDHWHVVLSAGAKTG